MLSFHWYSQLLESQEKQKGECKGTHYVRNVLKGGGTETLPLNIENK